MREEELHSFYESAVRYLLKDMSLDEQLSFTRVLNSDAELKHLFFRLKDVWEYHQLKEEAGAIDLNQVWKEMTSDTALFDADKTKSKNTVRSIQRFWQIAASIVLLIGIGWVMNQMLMISDQSDLVHVFECPKGDRVKINLADGSEVWLNADSKLTLPQNFSAEDRQLALVGEAYFKVKSDPQNPFLIDVAGRQVKVTGTSFNVRYYPEENLFQTTLKEGKVSVVSPSGLVRLKPGEQLNVDTRDGEATIVSSIDVEQFSAWRVGRFEFENMPMEELMNNVERWYNHEIIINDPELMKLNFSGVLKHNKSIEHFMEVLSLSHPISYEIVGDTIVVKPINKTKSRRMR